MKKTINATCVNITQANGSGTVVLQLDQPKPVNPPAIPHTVLALQFTDNKEAAAFEHGKKYVITITDSK